MRNDYGTKSLVSAGIVRECTMATNRTIQAEPKVLGHYPALLPLKSKIHEQRGWTEGFFFFFSLSWNWRHVWGGTSTGANGWTSHHDCLLSFFFPGFLLFTLFLLIFLDCISLPNMHYLVAWYWWET